MQDMVTLPLTLLVENAQNPNRMPEDMFQRLVAAVRKHGVGLQPILVRPIDGGKYEIVDGHHRARAAKEAGHAEVHVIIRALTDEDASILQLGMNRMRGEIDLGLASVILGQLHGSGMSLEDLVLTGFSNEEIDALLAPVDDEDAIEPALIPDPQEERPPAPFMLEVHFTRKEDFQLARKAIKRAAGKGGSLADGLLRIVNAS